MSGFNIILPTLVESLDIAPASQTWPASAFSLVVACFLLPSGRLSDMFGGYPVYCLGMLWLTIWSIIAGFSTNEIMMDLCRALQGFGPAAYLPSSLMLLGSIYRPGPRKNFVFSLYGACAPLGFFFGIFFAGKSLLAGNKRTHLTISRHRSPVRHMAVVLLDRCNAGRIHYGSGVLLHTIRCPRATGNER